MFWVGEDVDEVFDTMFVYLEHLKRALKKNTATDKGWTFEVTFLLMFSVMVPAVTLLMFVD